jgi:glycosyltransferase involved in cell wall biosynthesis
MHLFWLLLFGIIAFLWVSYGLRVAYGAVRLPWLKSYAPAKDPDCPRISLIVAARDEEEKLPEALATLLEIDYPQLEIIAVDDRSRDATPHILDDFAATHDRIHVIHISELPNGWLGKPHALQKAYEASSGDWLLFTDADVRFQPDTLRRAVALVRDRQLSHLTLFGDIVMVGFWEKVFLTFLGLSFTMGMDPHRVSNPRSRAYVGVGAFQMVKRAAYEECGTHRRLAMEVLEDVMLGKIVKRGGFRSGVAVAQDAVSVRWHDGIGNLIRGVEKNFFAGAQFSVPVVIGQSLSLLAMFILPSLGVFFGHGWVSIFSAIAVLIALCFHIGVDIVMRVSPFYCLTLPLGAALLTYMLLRSTFITLRQGGITWRGTFYSLEELRRRSR